MKRFFEIVRDYIMPPRCPCCRELMPFTLDAPRSRADGVGSSALCAACRGKWETAKRMLCPDCGLVCCECVCPTEELRRVGCDTLVKLAWYEHGKQSAAERLVLYMKDYRDRRVTDFTADELAVPLGRVLTERSIAPEDTVFTFAPRRISSVNSTGFDQAGILARRLASDFHGDFAVTVRRRAFTGQQKGLTPARRRKNAARAFAPGKEISLRGKSVVLVDDVVTTGATMAYCVRALKKLGAENIICASVLVAMPENEKSCSGK